MSDGEATISGPSAVDNQVEVLHQQPTGPALENGAQGALPPVTDKDNNVVIAPQVPIEATAYPSDASFSQVTQRYPPFMQVGGQQANSNISYLQPNATGYNETSSMASDGSQTFGNGSGASITRQGSEAVSNNSQQSLSRHGYPVAPSVRSGQKHSGIDPVAVKSGFPNQDGVVGGVGPPASVPLSSPLSAPPKKTNHHVPAAIPVQAPPLMKMPETPEAQPNHSQTGVVNQDANLPARGGQQMFVFPSGYQIPPGQYPSHMLLPQAIPQGPVHNIPNEMPSNLAGGQAPAPMNVPSAVTRSQQAQSVSAIPQDNVPVSIMPPHQQPQTAAGVLPESMRISQLTQQPAYPAGTHLYNGSVPQPSMNAIHGANSLPSVNGVGGTTASAIHSALPAPTNNAGGLYRGSSQSSVSTLDETPTVMKCLVHYGVSQMKYADKEWDIMRTGDTKIVSIDRSFTYEKLKAKMRLNEGESLKYIFEEHAILVESTEDVQNMMDEFERERSTSSNSRYNHVYVLLPESPQETTPNVSALSLSLDGRLTRQSSEYDPAAAAMSDDIQQDIPAEENKEPNKLANEQSSSVDDAVQDVEDGSRQTVASHDDRTAEDNDADGEKEQKNAEALGLTDPWDDVKEESESGDLDKDKEPEDEGKAVEGDDLISSPSTISKTERIESIRDMTARGELQVIPPDELEMQEMIGRGGFGVVWKALWKGAVVAVKELHLSYGTNEEQAHAVDEFQREAHFLGHLSHPNILTIYGIRLSPVPAIVSEFMMRGSLRTVLHEFFDKLSNRRKAELALDAARGMEYLHASKVVHYDLKTSNLLVAQESRRLVCKVGDFGLSRTRQAKSKQTASRMGTANYSAPEVIREGKFTEKVDVYSFGIVLWELLTGNIPFADLPEVTIMYKILNGARPNRDTVASPSSSPPTSTAEADIDKEAMDINQSKKVTSDKPKSEPERARESSKDKDPNKILNNPNKSEENSIVNAGNECTIKRLPSQVAQEEKDGESEETTLANGETSESNLRNSADEKTKDDNIESWPEWEDLMERCWVEEPQERPCFTEIVKVLCDIQAASEAS